MRSGEVCGAVDDGVWLEGAEAMRKCLGRGVKHRKPNGFKSIHIVVSIVDGW